MVHFHDLRFAGFELQEASTVKKFTILFKIKEEHSPSSDEKYPLKKLKCKIRPRGQSISESIWKDVYASVLCNFDYHKTFDLTKAKNRAGIGKQFIKLLNDNYGNRSIYTFENDTNIMTDQYEGYGFNTLIDIRITDQSSTVIYINIDSYPEFVTSNFVHFELFISEKIQLIFSAD
jgi:hypothetical protein